MMFSKRNSSSPLHIRHLYSGGLITNYCCSSACGHCLYNCAPQRDHGYIDAETCRRNLAVVKALGCHSIHIGGGEPFLHFDKLLTVLDVASELGVSIEYIETNSSWCNDENTVCERLSILQQHGVSCLLVSISPFHNEYIPFGKVKRLLQACRRTGMSSFPWIAQFATELDSFSDDIPHSLAEYKERFGAGYLKQLPSRYSLTMRGRALETFRQDLQPQPLESILRSNCSGCSELENTSHFHIDLDGNYIPGLCTGLAIRNIDLGSELGDDYRFLNLLYQKGIAGLLELAQGEYGFEPDQTYVSKCDLCIAIRKWLVNEKGVDSPDLKPTEYYQVNAAS